MWLFRSVALFYTNPLRIGACVVWCKATFIRRTSFAAIWNRGKNRDWLSWSHGDCTWETCRNAVFRFVISAFNRWADHLAIIFVGSLLLLFYSMPDVHRMQWPNVLKLNIFGIALFHMDVPLTCFHEKPSPFSISSCITVWPANSTTLKHYVSDNLGQLLFS